MLNFSTTQTYTFQSATAQAIQAILNPEDNKRLKGYLARQEFWKGNQWDAIPMSDESPRVTVNFCRMFADKLINKEFAGGVNFKFDESVEKEVLPFLKEVWEDNDYEVLLDEIGQAKGVLGDAYFLVEWESKYGADNKRNPDFDDPFDLYETGRIRVYSIPPTLCFPRFKDGYDSRTMESCTVLIPQKISSDGQPDRYKIIRRVYKNDIVSDYDGKTEIGRAINQYGVIPIVHVPNLLLNGEFFGKSDLEDLMDINAEINFKNSDVSEIIDYHASPITCVFGARVNQLEPGANKIWGGLPKDGKVEQLEMKGDLGVATSYVDFLKESMHELACVPKLATGSGELPANISSLALSIHFGPLIEVVEQKRKLTANALKMVNKIILKIGTVEKLISAPSSIPERKKFFNHDVIWGAILPKDLKTALEEIQQEMKMGLTTRKEALKLLKKDNIEQLIEDIDAEVKEQPYYHGIEGIVLSGGQSLINQMTGEEIAKVEAPVPTAAPIGGKTAQPSVKPVGTNKKGKAIKTPSGMSNKNPGKKN